MSFAYLNNVSMRELRKMKSKNISNCIDTFTFDLIKCNAKAG